MVHDGVQYIVWENLMYEDIPYQVQQYLTIGTVLILVYILLHVLDPVDSAVNSETYKG